MANAKEEGRNFLRMYNLEEFKVFNAKYKECLTGSEWSMLMYLLNNRLLYIRRDEDFMNGNWIKMDAKEKEKLRETLGVTQNAYERLIAKLVNGGIFYRIRKDFFSVNPWAFAKGRESDVEFARKNSCFRPATVGLEADEDVFIKKNMIEIPQWKLQEFENQADEINQLQKEAALEAQKKQKKDSKKQDELIQVKGCTVRLPA